MKLAEQLVKKVTEKFDIKPKFREGSSDEEIAGAEQKIGLSMPDELKELYKFCNGQDYSGDCLFDYFQLNSLDDMLSTWESFRDLEQQFENDGIKAEPEEGIRDKWCNSKWLPFANTADGHSLCIDFDPDDNGTIGQVITYWCNSEERNLVAKSFREFIESYLKELESGSYFYDAEGMAVLRKDGAPMFGPE